MEIIAVMDMFRELVGYVIERPVVPVIVVILLICFCVSRRGGGAEMRGISKERTKKMTKLKKSIPNGMGAVIDFSLSYVIGYYKDGVAYKGSRPIGSYKRNSLQGDATIYDVDSSFAAIYSSESGFIIARDVDSPVAEIFTHSEDEGSIRVNPYDYDEKRRFVFTDKTDPAGAAAVFVLEGLWK